MTSMPASRSARAMTLAPRSCPSRPGFATNTRIFLSFINLIVALLYELPQRTVAFDVGLEFRVTEKVSALGFKCLYYMWISGVVKKRDSFTSYRKRIKVSQLILKRFLRFLCNSYVLGIAIRLSKIF